MSDELHPWDELARRYRHDEDAQFLLFVEQFDEARQLVGSGELAKVRMALVAADNLAEVVLHRYKRRVLRIGDEAGRYRVPRLSKQDLDRLNREFAARVALGRRGADGPMLERLLRPVLDDLDEAIFRTGHAYRGRIYHADHHNPAVLPLITKSYLVAAGRAFVRLQPTGVASSMGEAQRRRYVALGYEGTEDPFMSLHMFAPADAAQTIISRLTEDLDVTLQEAKTELRADLVWRTTWAEEMIKDLLGELPVERLE